jgi:hypothetical protein
MSPKAPRSELVARIKELRAEIAATQGAKLQGELSAVGRMYKLFATNESELRKHFERHSSTQAILELWDANHGERFDAFLDETDRLLHNYLAAAASLADHTMRLWCKYPPQDETVIHEYRQRVDETFINAPVANLIQELRNVTVHRQLPVIRGELSGTGPAHEDGPSMRAVTGLDKNRLLASGDWKKGAKKYIEEADDPIDVEVVVAEYTAAVHGFNEWFSEAWVGAHRTTFEELHKLAAEHDELVERLPR